MQERQAPELLDVIHKANPTMLPAFINPIPLLSQPPPPLCASGKPSEAAGALADAAASFNRIAGARDILIQHFGANPILRYQLQAIWIRAGE